MNYRYIIFIVCLTPFSLFATERDLSKTIKNEISTVLATDPYFVKRVAMKSGKLKQIADVIQICKALEFKKNSGWFDELVYTTLGRDLIDEFDGLLYLSPEKFPLLNQMIHDLSVKHGIQDPLVFLAEKKDFYNACAVSVTQSNGMVILFKDLLDDMTDQQLKAVMAHELAHIKCGHAMKKLELHATGLVAFAAAAIGLGVYAYRAESCSKDLVVGMGCVGLVGLAIFHYSVAQALSRMHEYEADDEACKVMQDPDGFAEGIQQITNYVNQEYARFQKEHLFVLNEAKALVDTNIRVVAELFPEIQACAEEAQEDYDRMLYSESDTHPTNDARIARVQSKSQVQKSTQS